MNALASALALLRVCSIQRLCVSRHWLRHKYSRYPLHYRSLGVLSAPV